MLGIGTGGLALKREKGLTPWGQFRTVQGQTTKSVIMSDNFLKSDVLLTSERVKSLSSQMCEGQSLAFEFHEPGL